MNALVDKVHKQTNVTLLLMQGWLLNNVAMLQSAYHCVAFLFVCSSASGCIESSLHQPDFFQKSFNGDLFLFFFDINKNYSALLVPPTHPQLKTVISLLCGRQHGQSKWHVQHGSTLLRDRWKTLNVDCSFTSTQVQNNHPWEISSQSKAVLTESLLALRCQAGWRRKKKKGDEQFWISTISGGPP